MLKEIIHSYAPLTDHKRISLTLAGSERFSSLRGYWTFNNNLLKDDNFNACVKNKDILEV